MPRGHAHRVGDGCREQALERGQGGDGDGRYGEHPKVAPGHRRHRQGEQPIGQGADRLDRHVGQADGDRRDHHPEQRHGYGWPQAGEHEDRRGDPDADGHRCEVGAPEPLENGGHRRHDDVLGARGQAERGGHLLEGDEGRDAQGEPLDDGQRDEPHVPPCTGQAHHHEDHARHEANDEHALGSVGRHDRHEDDGHRPGGPGDLHVTTAEQRRHDAGDDRRHQAGGGAEPRGDAEGQGQGQGHDTHGHPGEDVLTRGRHHGAQVAAAGADGIQPLHDGPAGRVRAHARGSGVMSSTSPPWSAVLVWRISRALASRSRTAGRARL